MGKPVNLNRYRKAKSRAEKKARADRNSFCYGRSKAEKEATDLERSKSKKELDNHELDK
ncbi:DUF4169 family protein [Ruegeria arenilitoris]|uniref:DUF4169 family protein n=1 Tax=Ruegeria arenilitoris TaxID=1173585 RepID=UPI00147D5969|nr:DUF4169 family protein [Ruegeria arenilitoris]